MRKLHFGAERYLLEVYYLRLHDRVLLELRRHVSNTRFGIASQAPNLEKAAQDNPRDPAARGKLGMARHANGLSGRALEDYRQAIALDPSDPQWWYLSSIIESYVGTYEQGIADLDSAIARAPNAAHAYWRRGLLYLDQGDLDRAESSFQQAIQIKPNHPVAWIGRARVQLQGRYRMWIR